MPTLLVTYDLNKPGQDYSDFLDELKDRAWAKLSESSYAISSNESPTQVYYRLRPHMDDNDTIYIITLKKPYYGYGPEKVNDWLDANLPG